MSFQFCKQSSINTTEEPIFLSFIAYSFYFQGVAVVVSECQRILSNVCIYYYFIILHMNCVCSAIFGKPYSGCVRQSFRSNERRPSIRYYFQYVRSTVRCKIANFAFIQMQNEQSLLLLSYEFYPNESIQFSFVRNPVQPVHFSDRFYNNKSKEYI